MPIAQLGAAAALALVAFSGSARSQALPDGPGKELAESICAKCHATERIVPQRLTNAESQDKVLEMLRKEPDVNQEKRDKIVEYLARNFPKPASKLKVIPDRTR